MTQIFLLGNGIVVRGFASPEVIPDGGVAWQGGRIIAVGPLAELRRQFEGAHFVDARGGLIAPGFINLHHHLYSALARGLDPGASTRNFTEILDRLWWRLDRALDRETVRVSALLSAADCIRWGCTTVFDHHASPSCIAGSLDIIAESLSTHGLSGVLCYEVSDRNGHAEACAGIEENLRFLAQQRGHARIRGVFGLHASFTLRDETLADVAKRRPEGAGCHIHVAEDPVDVEASRRAFGVGPVERLERFGLLDSRALLAHGIHLQAEDYARIARGSGVVIHNPESNANNGVGRLNAALAAKHGCVVGLGTDGMNSAMLRALRAAYLTHRAASSADEVLPNLLANNTMVARRFFNEPLLGELSPGAPADIAVMDSLAPTPIASNNLAGHLIYGASEAPVRHTIARGRILLEDFVHATLDPRELAAHARELSPALWERFHALKWGTSFLG